jgi:predicted transposase/invertase (TIGR01784 family)
MREEIEQLPEEEAKRVFRLPNSYFERGVKQGRQEGIEQGMEKVAKKMLLKEMPKDDIADVTGQNIDEIEKIANGLKK